MNSKFRLNLEICKLPNRKIGTFRHQMKIESIRILNPKTIFFLWTKLSMFFQRKKTQRFLIFLTLLSYLISRFCSGIAPISENPILRYAFRLIETGSFLLFYSSDKEKWTIKLNQRKEQVQNNYVCAPKTIELMNKMWRHKQWSRPQHLIFDWRHLIRFVWMVCFVRSPISSI